MKSGFETGAPNEPVGKSALALPSVEEIAKAFPQLEIIALLGQGGMGAVYQARQPRLNRFVALKILSPDKQHDPQFAERFEREARALASLTHPNIVTVYDFGEAQGHYYLLMEFVDGLTLRQVYQARKLSSAEALRIVPKICEALQYAHEQGIVHRDIKPENILLAKSGRVKIADFGIAKILDLGPGDLSLTRAKDVVGTPHYMAPEQLENPREVDHRADIYSLGVVFYEMLTGELPLGKFQPPSAKERVDTRLDEVVLRSLAKEPELRYQQVSEVKTRVETIAATPQSAGPRDDQDAINEAEWRNPNHWRWGFYFSLRNSRKLWVPRRNHGVGSTLNLGRWQGAAAGLGIVISLIALASLIPARSKIPSQRAAVVESLLVPRETLPTGLTAWRWRCAVPAQHSLLFTVVCYSSNGVPSVSHELSSFCNVGSVEAREMLFDLTRQDGAMLSPELRDSCRWTIRYGTRGNWTEFLPVWTRKDPSALGIFTPGKTRDVIHDGETLPVVIMGQGTETSGESRRMEIQISLHALPEGMNVGSLFSFNCGTNWLESARNLANAWQRKASPGPSDRPRLPEPPPPAR